jgi:hypothetical protein
MVEAAGAEPASLNGVNLTGKRGIPLTLRMESKAKLIPALDA